MHMTNMKDFVQVKAVIKISQTVQIIDLTGIYLIHFFCLFSKYQFNFYRNDA